MDGLEIEGYWRVLVESIPRSESAASLCTHMKIRWQLLNLQICSPHRFIPHSSYVFFQSM